jgi:hypothetical protein
MSLANGGRGGGIQGGHAWSLKGKCRFCGMTRAIFTAEGKPDCRWSKTETTEPKTDSPPNDQASR